MNPRARFTQRLALACARHPWWTIAVWLVAVVAAAVVYLLWGDVFTSSSRFLDRPDSKIAADLVEQHGGGSGGAQGEVGSAARRLARGVQRADQGARRLAAGTKAVSSGGRELDRGLRRLAQGAGELKAGTARASAGTAELSQGLAGASQGASRLSSGMAGVSVATGSFSTALTRLLDASARLSAAASGLAGGAADLAAGAKDAAGGVQRASLSAGQLAGGAASLQQLVDGYLQAHPEAAGDATYQQIVALSGQLASGLSGLSAGLESAAAGTSSVAAGADRLATGAADLVAGARGLRSGLARSAKGARTLHGSAGALAAGSAGLAGGIRAAAAGSSRLAAGSRTLAGGSGRLAAGLSDAAGGAGQVAAATSALREGAGKLSKGLGAVAAGAGELSDALLSIGTLTNHDTEVVVVHGDTLTVDDPAFRDEVLALRHRIAALPAADVAGVVSRYDKGLDRRTRAALTSGDGHSTLVKVELATSSEEAMNHVAGLFRIVGEADATPGFAVAVTGAASIFKDAQDLAGKDLRRGEAIGIPVALVILVLVFGALVAAGLPLVLSIVSIVVGLALTAAIGHGFELSVFALNILTATGLAIGIDYSLFIVSRYREERRGGLDKMAAIGAASATASNAVFFSGMTVVLSLVGMLIVPLSIFTSLGIGAMSAVFGALAAALTLLPALLALLGDRIDALRVPWLDPHGRRHAEQGRWARATRRAMRRPAVNLVLGAVLLLAIAAPALTMRVGGFSADTFPSTYTSKQGLDMLERDFEAGMSEPVTVAIQGDIGGRRFRDDLEQFIAALREQAVFTVTGVSTSADGSLAVVTMIQDADAMSEKAKGAVVALRETLAPEAFTSSGASVYVGGTTAQQIDSVHLTDEYMPIVIGTVLALSFVLLLLAFRSVVVSATAIVMNLLSVGAAYGALTLVFQHGVGAGLLGMSRVEAIESWVPLLMFCVLFGLSMDYQVFLLSRIRERWSETRQSGEAVVFGVQSTAGIITGAALIMVAVFLGMGSGRLVVLQQLGFGLAVAVLLDAFAVRVLVAPAIIALIGDRYWWMPRWLEWLPHIDVEGVARPSESDVALRDPRDTQVPPQRDDGHVVHV